MNILVLNGPNLNLLGTREPSVYGHHSLADIEAACLSHGRSLGVDVAFAQSNSEGAMVVTFTRPRARMDGVVLNAGVLYAYLRRVRACYIGFALSVVELHVSNTHARGTFRHCLA